MKILIAFALSVLIAGAVQAEELVSRYAESASGYYQFEQARHIQGLPRPVISRGYLEVGEDTLRWVVQHPVASEIRISEQGIREISGEQDTVIEGSEFAARLLVAVLQQDYEFLNEYFLTEERSPQCMDLLPQRRFLQEQYERIELCGDAQLERLLLHEVDGGHTDIQLTPVDTVP